jgi:hypothetical protein
MLLTVALCNLSQLPFLPFALRSVLQQYIWLVCGAAVLLGGLARLDKKIIFPALMGAAFYLLAALCAIFRPGAAYFSDMTAYAFISLGVLFIGFFISKKVTREDFRFIFWVYEITVGLVAVSVYLDFFQSNFQWDVIVYSFMSKNSFSALLFNAIALFVLYYKPKKGAERLLQLIAVALMTTLLLMLRSRGTILGLAPLLLVAVFMNKRDRKFRLAVSWLLAFFVLLLFFNAQFYNFVVNNILFNGQSADNLDAISSGRLVFFYTFQEEFWRNPLLGMGYNWKESFPLCMLISYGIFGSAPLFSLILWALVKPFTRLDPTSPITQVYVAIFSAAALHGFFESFFPIGPGAAVYLGWLLLGLLLGWTPEGATAYPPPRTRGATRFIHSARASKVWKSFRKKK